MMSRTTTLGLENALADYSSRTKKEVIDVIREDSINDPDSIQVRQLSLSLSWGLNSQNYHELVVNGQR